MANLGDIDTDDKKTVVKAKPGEAQSAGTTPARTSNQESNLNKNTDSQELRTEFFGGKFTKQEHKQLMLLKIRLGLRSHLDLITAMRKSCETMADQHGDDFLDTL